MRNFSSLFNNEKVSRCSKAQILVNPFDEPRGVFFIRSGYVKAYTISKEGECRLIAILGPQEIFPLYWSLDEEHGDIYFESINALSFSIMEKSRFKASVLNDKELLRVAVDTLLVSFRFSHHRIQNMQLRTAQEKLAYRLIYLADNFGVETKGGINISVPVVYQDLADAVNITRETTNRVMRQFIDEGIVQRADHQIKIIDKVKLQSLLS